MKAIAAELLGLFVDDAGLAIGLLLWVLIAKLVLPLLALGPWGGPTLFLGAAIVLVASLRRFGR